MEGFTFLYIKLSPAAVVNGTARVDVNGEAPKHSHYLIYKEISLHDMRNPTFRNKLSPDYIYEIIENIYDYNVYHKVNWENSFTQLFQEAIIVFDDQYFLACLGFSRNKEKIGFTCFTEK